MATTQMEVLVDQDPSEIISIWTAQVTRFRDRRSFELFSQQVISTCRVFGFDDRKAGVLMMYLFYVDMLLLIVLNLQTEMQAVS